jgi:hypothetical protein
LSTTIGTESLELVSTSRLAGVIGQGAASGIAVAATGSTQRATRRIGLFR